MSMKPTVRVLRTAVTEGARFDIRCDDIALPSGRVVRHDTVIHPGAVIVLPVHSDGRLVLVNQYRHSVGREILEVPAGTLEEGESPQVCAARELAEECHLSARTWISLGVVYPAPGFCNEVQHIFLARDLEPCHDAVLDPDEILEVVEIRLHDLIERIKNGQLSDSKSMTALFLARIKGELE
jgi:ADP-ribose pyrophosphatase